MVDVSVLIVNYNAKKILTDCLESFYKYAEGFTFEIIIVDNSDKEFITGEILQNYPCIKFIKNPVNAGFAAANNQGIRITEGKYILFLNNDTIFVENSIKRIKEYCDSEIRDVMIGCRLLNADGSHQHSLVEFDNPWNSFTENFFLYKLFPSSKYFNKYYLNYYQGDAPVETDIIKGAFMFGPAGLFKKLKGFDERFYFYSEEYDLCYRFKELGGKVLYFPGTSIIHLGGAATDKIPWFAFKNKCLSKIVYYKKHYSGIEYFLLLLLHYSGLAIRVPVYGILGLFSMNKSEFRRAYYYIRQLTVYPGNAD